MLGSKSSSDRLSSPRWPGGARIDMIPKNTRPLDATSVNGVVLSGKQWKDNNAAKVMARSRVDIAATAEERIAQALRAVEIMDETLDERLKLDMSMGTNPNATQSPTNTQKNMDVYRGPEKWTGGSRSWEPPKDRSDIVPLMLETGSLSKPGIYSERRTSPRWEGGNRLDRDPGSAEYLPDFTATHLTNPGPTSSRRTSPRWNGGNRLDRTRGPPDEVRPLQEPTIFTDSNSKQVGDCLKPPLQYQ